MPDQSVLPVKRPIYCVGKQTDLLIPMRGDIPKLLLWFNDKEVKDFLTGRYPIFEKNEEGWLDSLATSKLTDQVFIIATKDGTPIGTVGIHKIDWISRVATLGIMIGEKSYWSKGHGTEAMILILEYALVQMNLGKIELDVHDFNDRAIACYKRCGFFEEGRRVRHMWKKNRMADTIQMGIFPENFASLWEKYQAS